MASPHFPDFLDELRARTEIEDTQKRFIRGIDRQDWALALSTYHDDAVDEHGFFSGPAKGFIENCARMHEHQDHSMHLMTNVLIEFTSRTKALVETYCVVFQRYGKNAPGVAPESHGLRKLASARYIDTFEQRTGAWKVARRRIVFGDIQSEQMSAPAGFPPGFTEQRHGMDDYLYAALAAARQG
ncbi:MAG: nuclear transport factor 2 family protein [Betaproteobacteria bacterium]|nr:nuclear transport factor 2 family protein [Betaproteobacteria bacterium]